MKRYLFPALAMLLLLTRAAEADRIHLPCDPDTSVGIGLGSFDGRTSSIQFRRFQAPVLRAELKLTPDQCDANRRLKRRWFGRVNLYLSVTPESSSLAYERTPAVVKDDEGNIVYQTDSDGNPILDKDGQKIPKTENTLTRADLHTGFDLGAGLGVRVSIYDGQWRNWAFHIEAFAELVGSPFFNAASIDSLSAHVFETDLDVTALGREHTKVKYRWWMYQAGLTIGVPFKVKALGRRPFVPYVVLGYAGFEADVRTEVDDELREDLENFGATVSVIEEPRRIRKHSPTFSLGARYDPSRNFSLETSAMVGYTGKTTVFWLSGSAIFRFDLF